MPTSDAINCESSYIDFDKLRTGGGWIQYPGAVEMVGKVRQAHPEGVNGLFIGLLKVPGYQIRVGPNGIIAVLIGLLMPAVQRIRDSASAERTILAGALASAGAGLPTLEAQLSQQALPGGNWGLITSPPDAASGMASSFYATINGQAGGYLEG